MPNGKTVHPLANYGSKTSRVVEHFADLGQFHVIRALLSF